MIKFDIGDLVRIGEVRGSKESVPEMHKFKNRTGKIIGRHPDRKYRHLVQIEDTNNYWFSEDILTPALDNRRYIDAFLEGKIIECFSDPGVWVRISAITPEIARRQMRFVKTEEVKIIEKEIESLREKISSYTKELADLDKQKKDIARQIKAATSSISRREKKIKSLS